jgi:dolichyl-phosphate beta-glucosyltransferase
VPRGFGGGHLGFRAVAGGWYSPTRVASSDGDHSPPLSARRNQNTVSLTLPTTLIVVPCFNEAERLPAHAFKAFALAHPTIQFVLVDDGSRDGTRDLLEAIRDWQPRQFHVLALDRNGGKAEAVRRGILHALDHNADTVGFIDADLAAPLGEIPRLVDVLARRDDVRIVVGSRLPLLGHAIHRRPLRRLLGRCFATTASRVLGLTIRDTQCGLKLFRGDDRTRRLFTQPFQSRWIFDVEILARLVAVEGAAAATAQVYEAPLESWAEVGGSKVRPRDFVKAFGELARIQATYRWRTWTAPPVPSAPVQRPVEPLVPRRRAS